MFYLILAPQFGARDGPTHLPEPVLLIREIGIGLQ
jgi:hypothetical protein